MGSGELSLSLAVLFSLERLCPISTTYQEPTWAARQYRHMLTIRYASVHNRTDTNLRRV
jgi:hypothetical protein